MKRTLRTGTRERRAPVRSTQKGGQRLLHRPRVALLIETSLASGRDILRGIARYVREHGRWSVCHEPRSLEESFPGWLNKWKGDGIIARVQTEAMAKAVLRTRVPVVDVLGVVEKTRIPLVHVDDRQIAIMAAEHLRERGFHHFAFFGILGENWSERRRDAFLETLASESRVTSVFEIPRHDVFHHSWEKREKEIADWLRKLPMPVGVMVCSDQIGALLLEACRQVGRLVPDEIAVVGVDNDQTLCEVCDPPLSSVNAGHYSVGYQAAALLERIMKREALPEKRLMVEPVGVVTRLSSEVLATLDRGVALAMRVIREQAHLGLTAAEVIHGVPVSRSVLQRRFRRELGRSIQEEIVHARLKRACDLLAKTDLPLLDVADRAGFKHQEYLGAVFKSHMGKTPGQYRKETRPG